jgi:hypothetical protein
LIRRVGRDHSQIYRRSFQVAFLLFNIWLGGLSYLWVRGFETGTQNRAITRPAGVEGWLPIAGLMNFKYWLSTGKIPATHPAAMFLFISFLAIAFLVRKAFCSWLCPVGTLSEYLWRAGRVFFRHNFRLPRWLDIPLRGLKDLLLGFFVWAVANMSADAIQEFMHTPYGAIADVLMLNFFRYLGETAAIVLAVLVIASVLVQTSGAGTSVRTERCSESFRSSARCAFAAPKKPASTARNARRPARHPCQSTSSSRLNRPNAPVAWNVSQSVPQKARCRFLFPGGHDWPTKAGFPLGQWQSQSPFYSWELWASPNRPATGTATFQTTSTGN